MDIAQTFVFISLDFFLWVASKPKRHLGDQKDLVPGLATCNIITPSADICFWFYVIIDWPWREVQVYLMCPKQLNHFLTEKFMNIRAKYLDNSQTSTTMPQNGFRHILHSVPLHSTKTDT